MDGKILFNSVNSILFYHIIQYIFICIKHIIYIDIRSCPFNSAQQVKIMKSVVHVCEAEVHGCGEQAHRAEQKKWKETQNAAVSWTLMGRSGPGLGFGSFTCENFANWLHMATHYAF